MIHSLTQEIVVDFLLWRSYCIELKKNVFKKKQVVNEHIKKVIILKSGKLQTRHFTVCGRRASRI